MKKSFSLLRWPVLITGCAQHFTVPKQTGSSSTKETITHHFFVSGIGQKKTVDKPKFVAAQKMLLNRSQQHS